MSKLGTEQDPYTPPKPGELSSDPPKPSGWDRFNFLRLAEGWLVLMFASVFLTALLSPPSGTSPAPPPNPAIFVPVCLLMAVGPPLLVVWAAAGLKARARRTHLHFESAAPMRHGARPPRDLSIGGGAARITVPGHLRSHTEADGNVLVYPPGDECITLRFTVLTATPPEPSDNPMLEFARSHAEENGWEFRIQGSKGVAYYEERAEERGQHLLMHFWEVGEGEVLTTLSATVLEQAKDDPRVTTIMADVPEILESLVVT